MTRRDFIQISGAGMAAAAASPVFAQGSKPLKLALVGTGNRGTMTWGVPVAKGYADAVQFVGLCDINPKRVKVAQGMIGTGAPTFTDFDEMVKQTKPDAVMVTTTCGTHYRYVVRSMELGVNPITDGFAAGCCAGCAGWAGAVCSCGLGR